MMPNKVSFGLLLDDLTEKVRVIGAVNTSFIRFDKRGQRRHIGTNPDCVDIHDSILYRMPHAAITAKGRESMVIGGGGAARSAIFALWKWVGSTEIYIANLKSEADTLINFFKSTAPETTPQHLGAVEAAITCEASYLVVKTIPYDISREPGEIICRQICNTILRTRDQDIMLNMCYLPSPVTYLYTSGQNNGWTSTPGTEVLARVCIAQCILWLEKDVDKQGVEDAMSTIWKVVSQGTEWSKSFEDLNYIFSIGQFYLGPDSSLTLFLLCEVYKKYG